MGEKRKKFVCGVLAAVLFLTGCATNTAGNEKSQKEENGAVSNSAVSSGPAAEGAENVRVHYSDRNDNCRYDSVHPDGAGTGVIERYYLDGELLEKLRLKMRDADLISVRYVDNQWLYYTRFRKGADKRPEKTELWRAPIRQSGGEDTVDVGREEKIFEPESVMGDIYVVRNYIYYNEFNGGARNGPFRKYDMEKGKHVKLTGVPSEERWEYPEWIGECQGDVFLLEPLDDGDNILYVQNVDTAEVKPVSDKVHAFSHSSMNNDRQIFFSDSHGDIMTYRKGQDKAEKYIGWEELQAAAEERGTPLVERLAKYVHDDEGFFSVEVDESWLYAGVACEDEDDGVCWFRCGLDGSPKPECAEELMRGLERSGFNKACRERNADVTDCEIIGGTFIHWDDVEDDIYCGVDTRTGAVRKGKNRYSLIRAK